MKKKRILTVILAAAMMFVANIQVSAATEHTEQTGIPRNEPILLTCKQLQELIETAPGIAETRSAAVLADRRITEQELAEWKEEYWELGGPNAFELEMVKLINIERQNIGLNPLAISPNLMMAARFHSTQMADLVFFNHGSPHHGRGNYRAEMFGHSNIQEHVWGVRENIASSTRAPYHVVQVWMNSPGHRAAIMAEHFLTIGIGAVQGGGTTAKFGS